MEYELNRLYYRIWNDSYVPEGSRFSEVVMGDDLEDCGGVFSDSLSFSPSVGELVEGLRASLGMYFGMTDRKWDRVKLSVVEEGFELEWYVRYEGDQFGEFEYVERIEDCDEVEKYHVSVFRVEGRAMCDIVRPEL